MIIYEYTFHTNASEQNIDLIQCSKWLFLKHEHKLVLKRFRNIWQGVDKYLTWTFRAIEISI
jgi:hypothetical protein